MDANEAKLATLNGPFFKADQHTFSNLLMDESFGAVSPNRGSFSGTFWNTCQAMARLVKTDSKGNTIEALCFQSLFCTLLHRRDLTSHWGVPQLKVVCKRLQAFDEKVAWRQNKQQNWWTKTLSLQLANWSCNTPTHQFIFEIERIKSCGSLSFIPHFMLHSAWSNLYSKPEMADDGRRSQLLATRPVYAEGIIKSKHRTVANDGRSS